MQRLAIPLDDKLAAEFDASIAARSDPNRSEAVRVLFRSELERSSQQADGAADCVARLSYVSNRHELGAAKRLTTLHHDHHDLLIASMHVPLDRAYRLETLALRGNALAVRQLADLLCAQRCVRHGRLRAGRRSIVALQSQRELVILVRASIVRTVMDKLGQPQHHRPRPAPWCARRAIRI
jgi:CopG family transcriptional regulator, nickel-responsive regulator